jgi:acetyl esterase
MQAIDTMPGRCDGVAARPLFEEVRLADRPDFASLAPAVRAVIEEMPPGVPEHLTPPERRAYMHLVSDLHFLRYGRPGPPVHSVSDHQVPVDGGEIVVRVYRPGAAGRLPGHLTLHGGGWEFGSVTERIADAICRQRCAEAECVVVSVDYRLAPEHRYPVPLDDCHTALCWTVAHADLLGIDPGNVSIGGSSAGGNLAAAVALRCRDAGGPALRFQLLEVPALDLTRDLARETLTSGVLPDVPQPEMFGATRAYLHDPAQAREPLASPIFAADLRGLPPAHVMTAEFDMLRTEGERYAERLREAGVPVTHRRYPGALHGTAGLTRTWECAAEWQRDAALALRRAHWGDLSATHSRAS